MSIPKQLFRFRPWSVLKRDRSGGIEERKCLDGLEDGIFFCSSPRHFDDPQDNQLGGHMTGSIADMERFVRFDLAGGPELMSKKNLVVSHNCPEKLLPTRRIAKY